MPDRLKQCLLAGLMISLAAARASAQDPLSAAFSDASAAVERKAAQRELDKELLLAAEDGDEDALSGLVAQGARINAFVDGFYPITVAAARCRPGFISALVAMGADIEARDLWGMTPLIRAVQSHGLVPGERCREAVLTVLRKKPLVNAADGMGYTPLMRAAEAGDDAMTELLFERGADASVRNSLGWTALHLAASRGKVSTVELLLAHGAPLNAQDEIGKTPLDMAKARGRRPISAEKRKVVEILERAGAR